MFALAGDEIKVVAKKSSDQDNVSGNGKVPPELAAEILGYDEDDPDLEGLSLTLSDEDPELHPSTTTDYPH